jgi:riboflavin synthase
MFTGIVEALGTVAASQQRGGDLRLRIRSTALDLGDVKLGDSIATNGVCLTVVALPGDGFWADVSRETLAHATLGELPVGSAVNLEKALRMGGRLDGHLVSGHVDGVGELLARWDDARSIRLRLAAPAALARYIAPKGSICVDGVSLTVNRVAGSEFELNIVPHTASQTIIANYRVGTRVNLEVDVIARYVERLLVTQTGDAPEAPGITMALLAQHGFAKTR